MKDYKLWESVREMEGFLKVIADGSHDYKKLAQSFGLIGDWMQENGHQKLGKLLSDVSKFYSGDNGIDHAYRTTTAWGKMVNDLEINREFTFFSEGSVRHEDKIYKIGEDGQVYTIENNSWEKVSDRSRKLIEIWFEQSTT